MTQHYYTQNPEVEHDLRQVIFEVLGLRLNCTTDAGVFSRDGLDMGTRILLEALPELHGRILDLGCGWGPVGTALGKRYPGAQIVLTDVNSRATELAARNLAANGVTNAAVVQGDGFAAVEGGFDAIVLNPPIRAGKAVIYALFAEAAKHLRADGALYIVIRKQQGAESAQKHLSSIYADVERIAREKGYWVLRCARPEEQHEAQ
ncbi:MAG: class I SAM-dependent methyltransferase [Eubacteriales bacterium]|nr:class I SAM-dependent methyltransferase [Eubacteriales bacterium]